jgi:hypothetical protein
MLRTERMVALVDRAVRAVGRSAPRQLLLAVASPPRPPMYALSGWPTWLIPAYRAGGHRTMVHLLEER